MKSLSQKKKAYQKSQLDQLTRKIKKSSPAATLTLIAESAAKIEDTHIKQWLLKFKSTFEAMQQEVTK